MILRPYQEKAVDAVFSAWENTSATLLQLATGTGKTIIFSEISKRLALSGKRVCILMHLTTLVDQTIKKLKNFWDGAIGTVCTGYSLEKDANQLITVASIQSITRYTERNPDLSFDYCIIDEAHHVPPKKIKSAYGTFLKEQFERNPDMHILGCTATPFRHDQGTLTDGKFSWFPDVTFSYDAKMAMADKFLAVYDHRMPVDIRSQLDELPISGHEYKTVPLSKCMQSEENLANILHYIREYGEGREHIAIYAVDIEHAKKITALLLENGIPTGCIHSKSKENETVFSDFVEGKIRALVSVAMLTEGYDFPGIDMIVIAVPTMSLNKHLQIIGRGLRVAPGKKNCLILDLAGNAYRHGTARNPVLPHKRTMSPNDPITVSCPECRTVNGVIPSNPKTYSCRKCQADLRFVANVCEPVRVHCPKCNAENILYYGFLESCICHNCYEDLREFVPERVECSECGKEAFLQKDDPHFCPYCHGLLKSDIAEINEDDRKVRERKKKKKAQAQNKPMLGILETEDLKNLIDSGVTKFAWIDADFRTIRDRQMEYCVEVKLIFVHEGRAFPVFFRMFPIKNYKYYGIFEELWKRYGKGAIPENARELVWALQAGKFAIPNELPIYFIKDEPKPELLSRNFFQKFTVKKNAAKPQIQKSAKPTAFTSKIPTFIRKNVSAM